MNYFKTLTVCLALLIGQFAAADIRTIALASEITLSDFRAPSSVNGVTSFKTCEDCRLQVVSVTKNTRYQINNHTVTLQNFRKSISTLVDRERETVIVTHHLESDVITSISINLL